MVLQDFIIENSAFALGQEAADWKAAVKLGTDLLVKAGAAEERYYEAILKMTEELGPYYVIAPGIAMPHTRPENGAKKTGFALVTLKNSVSFGHSDNDPVEIVLCICAKDAKDMNESVIVEAVTLFDDEKAVERLKKAQSVEDLRAVFADIEVFE